MPTVTKSIRIDAPRAAVWQRLSSLDRLAGHHPRATGTRFTSETTQGPGAEVRCELDDGGFTQRVASWEEGRGLTLDVVDAQGLPVKDAHVAFRIEDAGDGCVVGGAVTFRAPLGGLLARNRVVKELLVLDALKAALEQNVRVGPADDRAAAPAAEAPDIPAPAAKAPRRATKGTARAAPPRGKADAAQANAKQANAKTGKARRGPARRK